MNDDSLQPWSHDATRITWRQQVLDLRQADVGLKELRLVYARCLRDARLYSSTPGFHPESHHGLGELQDTIHPVLPNCPLLVALAA